MDNGELKVEIGKLKMDNGELKVEIGDAVVTFNRVNDDHQ